MLAIGIDPGTAITGYGLVRADASGDLQAVDWGVILTPVNTPIAQRLSQIYAGLNTVLKKHKPETAAVESLFFQKNVRTAMSVGQARGVVLLALQEAGLSITDYGPKEIKQAITGYGGADKRQMQSMVRTLLDLPEDPQPDDAADALAVAICHLHSVHRQTLLEQQSAK
ncbi:MAG: crossover junction endodeoxyribonuclease RuvC [Chloroflexi bacterium]|nr:crossover junction endodeoxyribonuclease RuvC [Chloroflexota bacterium]